MLDQSGVKKAAARTHLITLFELWESKLRKAQLSASAPVHAVCITFGAKRKLLIAKLFPKWVGGSQALSTRNVMYLSTIDEQRGIDLVKSPDGHSKEITQHELEDSAGD